MTLAYPSVRRELVDYLLLLVHMRDSAALPRTQGHELDDVIHFLFDDTPLADEPERALGYYLHDRGEVEAIHDVVVALDELLEEHGTQKQESEYVSTPEWVDVEQAARAAYALLVAKGDMATE